MSSFVVPPHEKDQHRKHPKFLKSPALNSNKRSILKKSFVLVDVREPHEYQISKIAGSTLIPLGEIPKRWQEIPQDQEIVLQCKAGIRSAKALLFLQQQGYKKLLNLKGGIDAWSEEIDPSLPRY